jgi:hypothetical protein
MRKILAMFAIAALAGVVASVATAAQVWTLTETKAERMLVREGTVHLAPADRTSLEGELRLEVARFRGLEMAAGEMGNTEAWWIYNSVASRYFLALQSVRRGLEIENAACAGAGKATGGNRFQRFNCLATSEVLYVPSTELEISGDDGLPTVLEGAPRKVGPLITQVRVRVTGKSAIEYR